MVKKRSNFIKAHKKLALLVFLFLLLTVAIVGRMIYERTVVNEMQTIANQLKVPLSATEQRDHIVSPSIVCIGDEPCPMYDRSWHVTSPLTKHSIQQMLSSSGIDATINGTCEPDTLSAGNMTLCDVRYSRDGYKISIMYNVLTYDRSRDNLLMRIQRDD